MKFYSYLRKKGNLVTIDKNSIVEQAYSRTKTDIILTESQEKTYVIALEEYLDKFYGIENEEEYNENKVSIEEYIQPTNTNEYFYRYISKRALNLVEKGIFKLGTLYEYQKTNDKHRGDIKEGHIHLLLKTPTKQHGHTFYGGYNFLITCGSYIPPDDARADYLLNNFGPCVIRIRNINSFLRMIKRHIRPLNTIYQRVSYWDIKAVSYNSDIDFNLGEGKFIDRETFDIIKEIINPFSIFRKTSGYSPECELRIAFKTPKNQKHPVFLDNKGLLDHIEIIKRS